MGDPNDPFEAFRRKKAEKKQADKALAEAAEQSAADAEAMGWIDGVGPAEEGPVDPSKPAGFNRGRYHKRTVDPSQLHRPAGYEETKVMIKLEDRPKPQVQKPRGFTKY